MKRTVLVIAVFTLLFASITDTSAQCGRRNFKNGKGNGNGYCYNNSNGPVYDLNSETSINGTVESYELIKGRGNRGGLSLKVKTSDGVIDVHVGPTWYLDDLKLDINKGDKLEIFGSKVTLDNDTFVIASKVKQNGNDFQLRDKYGYPKWAGNRRGNRN